MATVNTQTLTHLRTQLDTKTKNRTDDDMMMMVVVVFSSFHTFCHWHHAFGFLTTMIFLFMYRFHCWFLNILSTTNRVFMLSFLFRFDFRYFSFRWIFVSRMVERPTVIRNFRSVYIDWNNTQYSTYDLAEWIDDDVICKEFGIVISLLNTYAEINVSKWILRT